MIKRRGGGGTPSSGNSSSRDGTTSNRQSDWNFFSNDKLRTILITSAVWVLILSLTIFALTKYSSNNCSENSYIKSKTIQLISRWDLFICVDALCGIGNVLTRFCSDTDYQEPVYQSPSSLFSDLGRKRKIDWIWNRKSINEYQ